MVASVAILVLKLIPWGWRSALDRKSDLDNRVGLLQRMQHEVSSAARLEDSGVVVKGRLAAVIPKLLTGRTRAEATADLGARLAATASRHRVRVSRTASVSDTIGAQLGQVAVRTALESDTRGLIEFLDAMSRDSVVLVVDSVHVMVVDPLVSHDRAELVRTELTVRGWFLPGSTSQ